MKRFMTGDELVRDDRIERTPIPLDFLMADDVTVEQVEEMLAAAFGRRQKAAAPPVGKDERSESGQSTKKSGVPQGFSMQRLRPTDDHAPGFARAQAHAVLMGELQALEGAGRSCWDFAEEPDLPWKFQLDMARQCWDEARHTEIFSVLLEHLGGEFGDFPENLILFEFACSPDAAERVVGVNRCLEGVALDTFQELIRFGKLAEDDAIWRTVDFVAADEVTHVRFGQVWAKALTENDPERRRKVVNFQRKVDRAFSFGGVRGAYDAGAADALIPIATEMRRLAGFSEEELVEVGAAVPRRDGRKSGEEDTGGLGA